MKFCKQKRHFAKFLFAQIHCSRPVSADSLRLRDPFGIRSGQHVEILCKVSPHIWPSISTCLAKYLDIPFLVPLYNPFT